MTDTICCAPEDAGKIISMYMIALFFVVGCSSGVGAIISFVTYGNFITGMIFICDTILSIAVITILGITYCIRKRREAVIATSI